MATYAIGDVHGCTRTFRRLLKELPWDRRSDRLWMVGDLVGHGPDSAGTLRAAAALEADLGDRFVSVLGNHDARLLGAHAGVVASRKAQAVLARILETVDGAALLGWLARRPLLHHDGRSVLVHAGLHPRWTVAEARARARAAESLIRRSDRRGEVLAAALDDGGGDGGDGLPGRGETARAIETLRVMTTIRTLKSDGRLCDHSGPPEDAPTDCTPWFEADDRASRDAVVVFGHWAALGLRLGDGWIALDSGCAWGGPLSAVRLEDRRVFQTARLD